MMYKEQLAIAVKSHGRVLREHKDTVYLPFGSEYSIFIKNLNSVRAVVDISIDGTDVGDGQGFIVDGNSSTEIERFIKNGNLTKGNKFKFIEKTAAVEQHRGNKVEDGLIRIAFKFEKLPPKVINVPVVYHYPTYYPYPPYRNDWYGDGPLRYPSPIEITCNQAAYSDSVARSSYGEVGTSGLTKSTSADFATMDSTLVPASDSGITVPGSASDQQFVIASDFPTEDQEHVIVLKLLGEIGTKVVKQPVTVKSKPKCVTCGRVNKATAKFCQECGTSLEII